MAEPVSWALPTAEDASRTRRVEQSRDVWRFDDRARAQQLPEVSRRAPVRLRLLAWHAARQGVGSLRNLPGLPTEESLARLSPTAIMRLDAELVAACGDALMERVPSEEGVTPEGAMREAVLGLRDEMMGGEGQESVGAEEEAQIVENLLTLLWQLRVPPGAPPDVTEAPR